MASNPKNLAAATAVAAVELVKDTSRRLSADWRDMTTVISRECRDMGRELQDIRREIGQRIRSSSLHSNIPRLDIPHITFSTYPDSPCPTYTGSLGFQQGISIGSL